MRDELGTKQFFATPEHDCSYLADQRAKTLFLDPRETLDSSLYSALTGLGFRRSGSHIYRPHCERCQACVPTRVPVTAFRLTRRFKRVLKRNADLHVSFEPATFRGSYFHLYKRYIEARHADGDMHPATPEQFRSFLLSPWSDTEFLCVWRDDELLAVAVTDVLDDGLSAIYTFFEPQQEARSLGVYCILKQIEAAVGAGKSHLYLGYWIEGSAKMRYKIDYRPVELLARERWIRAT